ncbi:MAG TPA: acetate--CoA ligase family protein [Methanoregulaceae archaeon]|nr:MAG: acetate--CoA ligase family protein [Methanolinea sp.]HON80914.1 acetate--CoA ligase family protein [Methanoregulaceae archaeon]HPD09652.1 acetate--CoA ligase family protein [Methanoregulaceae archaeon]HRT15686.1 acetate--CoA ligase family protein [Methanoregulaceae archaeon]HRU31234.1 acetate--CoA ligase family protein [Methanoregulaceae archaeon]
MAKRELLTEDEGYRMLARFGIPVPAFEVVTTAEEAALAAGRMGFPVVMKVVSPHIVHKSDVGGVITSITGEHEAREAFDRIMEQVVTHLPEGRVKGVIVESELPRGLELFIGGKTDPAFGRVLSFGLGGTAIEIFRDFSLRVLPAGRKELVSMVRETRGYPLIAGYRNYPPLDEEELIRCLAGAAALFEQGEGVVEFDINPLILYNKGACAVDARVYREEVSAGATRQRHEFEPSLLSPESIAVIGASADPGKIGYAVFRNLLTFPGRLYPVNPSHDMMQGKKAYPSVLAIPEQVDMAVIAVPARFVPGIMEDLGTRGTKIAVIISSGFRETGEKGRLLEQEILARARKFGIRIIGPNCLGVILPHRTLNTTFDPTDPRQGHIAFISQSGAIITTVTDWSVPEEIGFSAIVSLGNQLDLDVVDFMRFAEKDSETRAVILYIEEIRDGAGFLSAVRDISPKKPVIVLKSGSSAIGRKAAMSHTGSLAGDFEVYRAAFIQAGAIPVYSLREAFDVAELMVSQGYPEGSRAIVITTAGGFAVLASDYAERFGVNLPPLPPSLIKDLDSFLPPFWNRANPMDIIDDGGVERFARVLDTLLLHEEAFDIAIVIAVPSAVLDPTLLAREIARFSENTRKMTIGCLLGGDTMKGGMRVLRHHRIPNYGDIENALRAAGRSIRISGRKRIRDDDLAG